MNTEKIEAFENLKSYIDSKTPKDFSLDEMRDIYLYLLDVCMRAKKNNRKEDAEKLSKAAKIIEYYGKKELQWKA